MKFNNPFNEIINKEKHTFSICDIDSIYKKDYDGKTRFCIIEVKNNNEKISKSQFKTLKTLNESICWKEFDNESGVYIARLMSTCADIENKKDKRFIQISRIEEMTNFSFISLNQFILWINAEKTLNELDPGLIKHNLSENKETL